MIRGQKVNSPHPSRELSQDDTNQGTILLGHAAAARSQAVFITSTAAVVVALWVGSWLPAEERAEQEIELYHALEKELALLPMQFYRKDFRLTEEECKRYENLQQRIEKQMLETGHSARGWWLIGRCRELLGNVAGAEEAYDEAVKIDANYVPSLLRKGRLLLERALMERAVAGGDEERARRSIELAREGENWVARASKAESLSGAVETEEAAQEKGMGADLARAFYALVDGWGKRRYAAEAMTSKWKGAPLVEEFLLLEGISHSDAERITKVIEKVPSYAAAYLWRGACLAVKGNLEDAIADYSHALEINPRYLNAYYNRGVARSGKGDIDGAIQDFNRALEFNPRFLEAYVHRGAACLLKGDFDGATDDYNRALQIAPL